MPKTSRRIQMAKISQEKVKTDRKIKKSHLCEFRSNRAFSSQRTCLKPVGKISKRSRKPIQPPNSQGPFLKGSSQREADRITRKDIGLHKLVFKDAELSDGTELAYYSSGVKKLVGRKKGSGIFCYCCEKVVSASQFEAHAGFSSRKKPYSYIYVTKTGESLHQLADRLKKRGRVGKHDSNCNVCTKDGDLLLCDGCPRAFHMECANLTVKPCDKWFCPSCECASARDSYAARNVNAIAVGSASGVNTTRRIRKQPSQTVKSKSFQDGETFCYLCRGSDFSESGFGPRTILLCDQCEREYHVGCLKTHEMVDLKNRPRGKWFCCSTCGRMHSYLQSLLNEGAQKLPDNLIYTVKRKHMEKNLETGTDFDVCWQLLSGRVSADNKATTKRLLNQAICVLRKGFGPIKGATGGDLIPKIVYGKKAGSQQFRGMYCAVLMVNSQIVSVAVFRMFGQQFAELPLIATLRDYQGKGFFRVLLDIIYGICTMHGVKKIVVPATEAAEAIWLHLGFKRMTSEQIAAQKKVFPIVAEFSDVVIIEKRLTG